MLGGAVEGRQIAEYGVHDFAPRGLDAGARLNIRHRGGRTRRHYSQDMWNTSSVRASLTVHGEDLDPDRVTALLKATPDHSHRVGQFDGNKVPPRAGWSISSTGSVSLGEPLSTHVRSLLNRVTANREAWDQVADADRSQIVVGWFMDQGNEMVELDRELLAELADRHLDLVFDVYRGSADSIPHTP
jgi:hypothetical protein